MAGTSSCHASTPAGFVQTRIFWDRYKAVAKALRHVRKQNWTEELSRRDYAVIGPLMLDGYADSQITDSMAPIIKCTDKTGMRQHVDQNFESAWTIISLSFTA